jgi:hypothetical protein
MIEQQKMLGENTESLENELNKEKRMRAAIREEGLKEFKDALDKQLQNLEIFNIEQERLSKEAAKSKKTIVEKSNDDELKAREKLAQAIAEQMERERQLYEDMYLRSLDGDERALAEREKQLQRELELAGNNLELQKALRREYNQDILAIEEQYQAERDALQAAADAKEVERKEQLKQATIAISGQALGGIAALAEAFSQGDEKRQRKAFTIKKAADLAKAGLDGTTAVLNTFAQTPGGIGLKAAAAAAAGLFATAQIAKIAQTQFQGGATSVSAGVPSSVDTSPVGGSLGQGSGIGSNNTTNTQQLLNGGGNGQVLVVDSLSKVAADVNKINVVSSV